MEMGQAQTGTNVATAVANQLGNMVDQTTPYGTKTYEQKGSFSFTDPNSGTKYDLPKFMQNVALNADGQYLQGKNMQAQKNFADLAATQSGRLGEVMGKPIDLSDLPERQAVPELQTSLGNAGPIQSTVQGGKPAQESIAGAGDITRTYGTDFSKDRQRVEDALMSRLDPKMQQDRAALENRLRQQGLQPGSTAWDREMTRADQGRTDARMQAILAGGQEQSRMTGLEAQRAGFQNAAQSQAFGQNAAQAGMFNSAQQQNLAQNLAMGQFANSAQGQQFQQNAAGAAFGNQASTDQYKLTEAARANALNEKTQMRQQPFNEIMALMSGSQVKDPTFGSTPGLNMGTTDYAGLMQQGHQNDMQAYQQKMANWNGMWGGLMSGGTKLLTGGLG